MKFPRIKGTTRSRMERELGYYLAALNVDPQFGVRKAAFLVRTLALPTVWTVRQGLEELMKRLALAREQYGIGRPWTVSQLEKCYWAKHKRFIRRPPMPMTKTEIETYTPSSEAARASRALALKKWREDRKREAIKGRRKLLDKWSD